MKAIALISGGLDSMLAALTVHRLGIEVVGVKFEIPFYLRRRKPLPDFGISVHTLDIGAEYLEMFKSPQYGFGANLNPCIDCKILMLAKAKAYMAEIGASFLITGEVVGQRPMSQHRQALALIPRKAGVEGLVLRPLCAKHLEPTIPEKEGWIDRSKLLDFNGRSRKPQYALAREYGITEYAQPAGGCLLTDPGFARRLAELGRQGELTLEDIQLLKLGRHFRLAPRVKLIVGRDEQENKALEQAALPGDHLFMANEVTAGPVALGKGEFTPEAVHLACSIVCKYCDTGPSGPLEIVYRRVPQGPMRMTVQAAQQEAVERLRI